RAGVPPSDLVDSDEDAGLLEGPGQLVAQRRHVLLGAAGPDGPARPTGRLPPEADEAWARLGRRHDPHADLEVLGERAGHDVEVLVALLGRARPLVVPLEAEPAGLERGRRRGLGACGIAGDDEIDGVHGPGTVPAPRTPPDRPCGHRRRVAPVPI